LLLQVQAANIEAFGAGCFWGVEKIFQKVDGVVSTSVGYSGGQTVKPNYKQVVTGATGHAESMEVLYDPEQVAYEELLITFWEWHDPTTPDQQGPDIGTQYRSVIFYHDAEQKRLAEMSRKILEESGVYSEKIVTEIVPATPYYPAEEYHQDYLKKNPFGYCSHKLESSNIRGILQTGFARQNQGAS